MSGLGSRNVNIDRARAKGNGVSKSNGNARTGNTRTVSNQNGRQRMMDKMSKKGHVKYKQLISTMAREDRNKERIKYTCRKELKEERVANPMSIESMERMSDANCALTDKLSECQKKLKELIPELMERETCLGRYYETPGVRMELESLKKDVEELSNLTSGRSVAFLDVPKSVEEPPNRRNESSRSKDGSDDRANNNNNNNNNNNDNNNNNKNIGGGGDCVSGNGGQFERTLESINKISDNISRLILSYESKLKTVKKIKRMEKIVADCLEKQTKSESKNQAWLASFAKHARASWCPTLSGGISKPTYACQSEQARMEKIERAANTILTSERERIKREKLESAQKKKKNKRIDDDDDEYDEETAIDRSQGATRELPSRRDLVQLGLANDVVLPRISDVSEHGKRLDEIKWAAKTSRNK